MAYEMSPEVEQELVNLLVEELEKVGYRPSRGDMQGAVAKVKQLVAREASSKPSKSRGAPAPAEV